MRLPRDRPVAVIARRGRDVDPKTAFIKGVVSVGGGAGEKPDMIDGVPTWSAPARGGLGRPGGGLGASVAPSLRTHSTVWAPSSMWTRQKPRRAVSFRPYSSPGATRPSVA